MFSTFSPKAQSLLALPPRNISGTLPRNMMVFGDWTTHPIRLLNHWFVGSSRKPWNGPMVSADRLKLMHQLAPGNIFSTFAISDSLYMQQNM
jgi:hypothetical protein